MRVFNLAEELEKERKKNKELKAELKEANESITWWTNRFNAVEEEIQILKKEKYILQKHYKEKVSGIISRQYKINQAIEYIEKHKEKQFAYNYEYNLEDKEVCELLNILKGEDNGL